MCVLDFSLRPGAACWLVSMFNCYLGVSPDDADRFQYSKRGKYLPLLIRVVNVHNIFNCE